MRIISFNMLVIILMFFSCFINGVAIAQNKKYIKPAEHGVLDISNYDAPLSFIDKGNFTKYQTKDEKKQFESSSEYVKEMQIQDKASKEKALSQIDNVIDQFAKSKKNYDESRRSYKTTWDPYSYDDIYSTDPRDDYRYYNGRNYRPYPYYYENFSTGVDSCNSCPDSYSQSSDNYTYNQGYMGYQPYMNILNFPGYLNNNENLYDGQDNDNDNFVDEGFNSGNVQIIIGDSGVNKDDRWSLYVDDKYMGVNTSGKIRNWDLNLYHGTHKVVIIGDNIPDDSGTYTVVFRNANVVSGPPLSGENLRQNESLTWIIKVK